MQRISRRRRSSRRNWPCRPRKQLSSFPNSQQEPTNSRVSSNILRETKPRKAPKLITMKPFDCHPIPQPRPGTRREILTHLNNPTNITPRLLKYRHHILAAALRLLRNTALDQIALRIRGNLAGDKDMRAGSDGLRLATSSALYLNAQFQVCNSRSPTRGWD